MSETDIVERLRAKSKDFTVSGGMLDGGKLYLEAAAEITRLRAAIEPFAAYGRHAVEMRENDCVWSDSRHREPLSYWLGPSDFAAAIRALSPLSDGGER